MSFTLFFRSVMAGRPKRTVGVRGEFGWVRGSSPRMTEPKDRITEPKDRMTESKDRITEPKDRMTEPKDRIAEPKDRIAEPKQKGPGVVPGLGVFLVEADYLIRPWSFTAPFSMVNHSMAPGTSPFLSNSISVEAPL